MDMSKLIFCLARLLFLPCKIESKNWECKTDPVQFKKRVLKRDFLFLKDKFAANYLPFLRQCYLKQALCLRGDKLFAKRPFLQAKMAMF